MSDAIQSEEFPVQPQGRQPLELVHSSRTTMPLAFFQAMYEPVQTPESLSPDVLKHFRQEPPNELTISLLTTVLLHSAGVSHEAKPLPPTKADKINAAKDATRSFNSPTGSILPDSRIPVRHSKTYTAVAATVGSYETAFRQDYPIGTSNMRISDEIYDPTDDFSHTALNLMAAVRKEIGIDRVRSAERVLRYIMLKTVMVAPTEADR